MIISDTNSDGGTELVVSQIDRQIYRQAVTVNNDMIKRDMIISDTNSDGGTELVVSLSDRQIYRQTVTVNNDF